MPVHINQWRILLTVVIGIFVCVFSLLGLWRHWNFLTSLNDLGCFDQAIWMASKGGSLENTSILGIPMNWLGFHFQPGLFLYAQLYKISPSVNWLIISQATALAISAWPIYLIAEQETASGKAAFIWSLAYLCNPFLLNSAAWDFHPVSLAAPILSLGLLAIARKQTALLVFTCLLLLTLKEDMGLLVTGLGLLYGISARNWPAGISLSLLGFMVFAIVVFWVMPSFTGTGHHVFFSDHDLRFGRYSWMGSSPLDAATRIITSPVAISRIVFTDMGGFDYLLKLLVPFLFLPVLALTWLLPALGDLVINLLSAVPLPRSIYSYHSITLIPLLTVAAIQGSNKLAQAEGWLARDRFAAYILLMSAFLGYIHAPFPFPGSKNIWDPVSTIASRDERVPYITEMTGGGSLSVQANVGSHFSQRALLYRFPDKVGTADYIVLRLDNPSHRNRLLTHMLQMRADEYLELVRQLIIDNEYGVIYWDNPWLVLQLGKDSTENTSRILSRVESLRRSWNDAG